jgi:hypothetical protein
MCGGEGGFGDAAPSPINSQLGPGLRVLACSLIMSAETAVAAGKAIDRCRDAQLPNAA